MVKNLIQNFNTFNSFNKTLYLSIITQIITAIIEISALFKKIDNKFILIRQLLKLELGVQVIEGLFYIWAFYTKNKLSNLTPFRYIDWALTTPTMLITLVCYLIFLKYNNKNYPNNENDNDNYNKSKTLKLIDIIKHEKNNLMIIIILNALMLLFGYLGEVNILNTFTSVSIGFIPFLIYYFIIYKNYVKSNTIFANKLFLYFFITWGLYGIAAYLPYYIKNSFYNILDLFAKNFFGIFLSYIIFFNKY